MKNRRRQPAGQLLIGTKTAKQISSRVTRDMKNMHAHFGPFPERAYSTRVWVGGVTVQVPPTPMYGPGMNEIVPMLEAAGYTVKKNPDGRSLNLAHPFWTEAN